MESNALKPELEERIFREPGDRREVDVAGSEGVYLLVTRGSRDWERVGLCQYRANI